MVLSAETKNRITCCYVTASYTQQHKLLIVLGTTIAMRVNPSHQSQLIRLGLSGYSQWRRTFKVTYEIFASRNMTSSELHKE